MATTKKSSTKKAGTATKTTTRKTAAKSSGKTGSKPVRKNSSTTRRNTANTKNENTRSNTRTRENTISTETKLQITFYVSIVIFVLIYLCLFGIVAEPVGTFIKNVILGVFGLQGFVLPVLIGVVWFLDMKLERGVPLLKFIGINTLVLFLGAFLSLISPVDIENLSKDSGFFGKLYSDHTGGGILFGIIAILLVKVLGKVGSIIICLLIILICLFIISGKSMMTVGSWIMDKIRHEDYDEDEDGQYQLKPRRKFSRTLDTDEPEEEEEPEKPKKKKKSEGLFDLNRIKIQDETSDYPNDADITGQESLEDAERRIDEEILTLEALQKKHEENQARKQEIKQEKELRKAAEYEMKEDDRIVNSSRNNIEVNVNHTPSPEKSGSRDDVHSINIVEETGDIPVILGAQAVPNPQVVHTDMKELFYEGGAEPVIHSTFDAPIINPANDQSNFDTKDEFVAPVSVRHTSGAAVNNQPLFSDLAEFNNEEMADNNKVETKIKSDDDFIKPLDKTQEIPSVSEKQTSLDNQTSDYISKEPDNKTDKLIRPGEKQEKDIMPVTSVTPKEATHVPRINDTPMEVSSSVATGIEIKPYGEPDKISAGIAAMPEPVTEKSHKIEEVKKEPQKKQVKRNINYKKPDISLLNKNKNRNNGDSNQMLKETALKLQDTLKTFGVPVTVSDISQGPSVTRYELTLGEGIKVSKIVSLTDDLKLNLAAQDIRIEAPIPGKAAVGIEIPNKVVSDVLVRDLLETGDFQNYQSNIAFGVGKDISGKTIVADIAKMPHMLIAGSTGSGKSVCINTLIMSILYKAHPDDVKLIMIDPKVVELSVYNGIPHLMLPVVTDPKKASATLKWTVNEMTNRYNAFAQFGVRDLKGFNQKAKELEKQHFEDAPEILPQIVVIVDELADLMMVASKEVEESICRLAQLARAAGIHLIIATQRPSVDVITGLIKANMPSRVAFRVSSGVDSRTILDSVGAERLLGKGDMLFYPQGYNKPLRVQGAFVSDEEVSNVVEFLKKNSDSEIDDDLVAQINNLESGGSSSGNSDANDGQKGSDYDEYFKEACKFVVEKGSASSGMLQRVYRIGFNRAARMIDQMESIGIVSKENGTKPRTVLVSMAELDNILNSI